MAFYSPKPATMMAFTGFLLATATANGAPGPLPDVPLNLESTQVQPNILFLIDDSGSMDWEILLNNADNTNKLFFMPSDADNLLKFSPYDDATFHELCVDYNVMAYNPGIRYTPWFGVDQNKQDYSAKTLTTALENPYDSEEPEDISRHIYTTWKDRNSDSALNRGECGFYTKVDDLTPGGHRIYKISGYEIADDNDQESPGARPIRKVTQAVGYLTDSGGVGGYYQNSEQEGFMISPTGATAITLSFSIFDVENIWDFLTIYPVAADFDPDTDPLPNEFVQLSGDKEDKDDENKKRGIIGIASPAPADVNFYSATEDSLTFPDTQALYIRFTSDLLEPRTGFVLFWNHSDSGITTPTFSSISFPDCRDDPNCQVVADLPVNSILAPGETNTQENYANWYTYYRKRDYVVKRALSEIISGNTSRVGLATINNNGGVGTLIADINDTTRPVNEDAKANKAELMANLFAITPALSTPLRRALHRAGRYFEQGVAEGAKPLYNDADCRDCGEVKTGLFGFKAEHTDGATVDRTTPILAEANGGACQQNFTILFSDGSWNGEDPDVGDTDSDGPGQWDGGTFADGIPDTLADVAMHHYERDLTDLDNEVDAPDIHNPNADGTERIRDEQHMSTYTIAFGVNGELKDNPDPEASSFSWPSAQQAGDDPRKIDDMRHAAWNGRGEFLNAIRPQELIESLKEVISDIDSRTANSSSASFNSGTLSTDTLVFQSLFNSNGWWGDLLAYKLTDSNGDGELDAIDGASIWSADEQMSALLTRSDTAYQDRNIITYNGEQGIPFTTFPKNYNELLTDDRDTGPETLSDQQIKDLLTDADFPFDTADSSEIGANATFGQQVVDYLRGDQSNSAFRERDDNFLGAFVHSSPEFVGSPSERYPNQIETTPYNSFANAYSKRRPLVYIGGNGGMLHAFDASAGANGGEEVFAYIPSAQLLHNGLHLLARRNYSHHAYVDGSPSIRDIFVESRWQTFLVGSLRTGGKGVFVLNITDPSALGAASDSPDKAAAITVGEFTHKDLGFTFSRPQVARMNNGRWAAIFGNGYNADNQGDGKAKLFILYLDELADGFANENDDFLILETDRDDKSNAGKDYIVNGDCLDPGSDCNGLSSPSLLDLNGDGSIDRIYAGDLHGNMWAFDVSATAAKNWRVAHGVSQPLFTAKIGNQRQPITAKPVVDVHPFRRRPATAPNLMVYFGTGQYIAQNDRANTDLQSFYGIWDSGPRRGGITRANIMQQTITTDNSAISATRTLSNEVIAYGEGDKAGFGWYIDLQDGASRGERSVSTPLIQGDIVFFVSIIPDADICSGGGRSFLMAVEAVDGSQPDRAVFDFDGDGKFTDEYGGYELDAITFGVQGIDGNKVADFPDLTDPSSTGINLQKVNTKKSRQAGRKSWSIIR